MKFSEQRPIYLQIAHLIGGYILSGEWAEGVRIPSVREFGVSLAVNPATVLRAYDDLSEKGIIEQRRGIGYFVCVGAKAMVHRERKEEFFATTLPCLYKEMKDLGITIEEVVAHRG